MKHARRSTSHFLVIAVLLMSFLLSACGGSQAAPTQQAALATEAPTKALPAPSSTPVPEPTPSPEPPIPCTIVFESDRDQNREVYSMGPDGANPLNLSKNPADDHSPVWSPDGKYIAFVSDRENEQDAVQAIYVMNADGSDVRQLTFNRYSVYPHWSHDGSRIVCASNGDIVIIKADGSGEPVNLTNSPENDSRPVWSPDDTQIAWISGANGNENIFVMNADGTQQQQINDNGTSSFVRWAEDGRLLAGWGWKDKEKTCDNCVFNADGSNIMDAGGKGDLKKYTPFYTRDGQRVEVASVDFLTGDEEIYLVGDIFPDMFLNLTNNPARDENPQWPANCTRGYPEAVAEAASQANQVLVPGAFVIGYEGDADQQGEADLQKACTELQIQCVRGNDISALVAQGVDAILSFSNQWKAQGDSPAIWDAAKSEIPVIVLNGDADQPMAYNLSTNLVSVRASVEWMLKQMGGQGDFVYYNFGNNELVERTITSALENFPDVKATAMPGTYDKDSISENEIKAMVEANPNIRAIWANNEVMDVFWDVKSVGNSQTLPAVLCDPREDNFENWKNILKDQPAFTAYSTIPAGGTAYEGVYVAYYLLSGKQINPDALGGEFGNTLIYDYPIVTNENLEDWIAKSASLRRSDWGSYQLGPMSPGEILQAWFLD